LTHDVKFGLNQVRLEFLNEGSRPFEVGLAGPIGNPHGPGLGEGSHQLKTVAKARTGIGSRGLPWNFFDQGAMSAKSFFERRIVRAAKKENRYLAALRDFTEELGHDAPTTVDSIQAGWERQEEQELAFTFHGAFAARFRSVDAAHTPKTNCLKTFKLIASLLRS
jgi:hypothetical protein